MKEMSAVKIIALLAVLVWSGAARSQPTFIKAELLRKAVERIHLIDSLKMQVPIERQCNVVLIDVNNKYQELRSFFQSKYCLFSRKEAFVLNAKKFVELHTIDVEKSNGRVVIVLVDMAIQSKQKFNVRFIKKKEEWIIKK